MGEAEFQTEEPKKRVHLGELGLDGSTILKSILIKQGPEDMGWISQVQDRIQWQAVVNAVMTFWFLYKADSFLNS